MKSSTDKKSDFAPLLKSIILILWVIEMKNSIRRRLQRIDLSSLFLALLITSTLYVTATNQRQSTDGGLKINTFFINQIVSFQIRVD